MDELFIWLFSVVHNGNLNITAVGIWSVAIVLTIVGVLGKDL